MQLTIQIQHEFQIHCVNPLLWIEQVPDYALYGLHDIPCASSVPHTCKFQIAPDANLLLYQRWSRQYPVQMSATQRITQWRPSSSCACFFVKMLRSCCCTPDVIKWYAIFATMEWEHLMHRYLLCGDCALVMEEVVLCINLCLPPATFFILSLSPSTHLRMQFIIFYIPKGGFGRRQDTVCRYVHKEWTGQTLWQAPYVILYSS